MEKRFELMEEELQYWIHDIVTRKNYYENDLCWLVDLLNEQDEKIKELELYRKDNEVLLDKLLVLKQENQRLKKQIIEKDEQFNLFNKMLKNENFSCRVALNEVQELKQENQRLKNIQRSSKMLCWAINLVIEVYLKASEQKFPNLTKEQLIDLCLSFIKDEIDWFLEVTKKKK